MLWSTTPSVRCHKSWWDSVVPPSDWPQLGGSDCAGSWWRSAQTHMQHSVEGDLTHMVLHSIYTDTPAFAHKSANDSLWECMGSSPHSRCYRWRDEQTGSPGAVRQALNKQSLQWQLSFQGWNIGSEEKPRSSSRRESEGAAGRLWGWMKAECRHEWKITSACRVESSNPFWNLFQSLSSGRAVRSVSPNESIFGNLQPYMMHRFIIFKCVCVCPSPLPSSADSALTSKDSSTHQTITWKHTHKQRYIGAHGHTHLKLSFPHPSRISQKYILHTVLCRFWWKDRNITMEKWSIEDDVLWKLHGNCW